MTIPSAALAGERPWNRWRMIFRCVIGMARRDLYVLRRSIGVFAFRFTLQPFLLVFSLTYVFPKVGQAIGGEQGATFSTLLVPGMVGSAILMQGIPSLFIPLVGDLNVTREIEDRATAPVPTWGLAASRIVTAAFEGMVTGLLVFPFARFIPSTPVNLEVSWSLLIPTTLLAALLGASMGFALGTNIGPSRTPLIFAILVVPVTFLGATYYPWAALDSIQWLKWTLLLNPLLYVNEAFRAALTPSIPHMFWGASLSATLVYGLLFWTVGMRGLGRKLSAD